MVNTSFFSLTPLPITQRLRPRSTGPNPLPVDRAWRAGEYEYE